MLSSGRPPAGEVRGWANCGLGSPLPSWPLGCWDRGLARRSIGLQVFGAHASGLAADVVEIPIGQFKPSFIPHGSRTSKWLWLFCAIFVKDRKNDLSALPAAD